MCSSKCSFKRDDFDGFAPKLYFLCTVYFCTIKTTVFKCIRLIYYYQYMTYTCDFCNYSTEDSGNYCKHKKTRKHQKMYNNCQKSSVLGTKCTDSVRKVSSGAPSRKKLQKDKKRGISRQCPDCGKVFSRPYCLRRHLDNSRCVEEDKVKWMETKMRICEEELRKRDEDIRLMKLKQDYEIKLRDKELECIKRYDSEKTAYIMSGKAGTTYNLSVKGYCERFFPDAPPLKSLTLDTLQTLGNNTEGHSLIDMIVYEHTQKKLTEYLGAFILKHYRKRDPKLKVIQSMWASDAARFNYVIRETLDNNEGCWIADKNGLKTREKVIVPILEHVKNEIDEYQQEPVPETFREQLERMGKMQITELIRKDIVNKKLEDSLLRFIAPHFHLDTDDPLLAKAIGDSIGNPQIINKREGNSSDRYLGYKYIDIDSDEGELVLSDDET